MNTKTTDESRSSGAPGSADLIAGLVRDLEAVRPVRLAGMAATAVAIEVTTVLVTAWFAGARPAAIERLSDPMFLALLALLGAGALASVVTMAKLSVPGRVVAGGVRVALLVLPLVLALGIVAVSPWGSSFSGVASVFLAGAGCTRNTILIATPAWIAGLLYLRGFGSLDPFGTGLFASSAALFASALVVQMACPNCESWHLAVSHYSPILVASWVAALLSIPVLSRSREG
jgi:hypothetical protein